MNVQSTRAVKKIMEEISEKKKAIFESTLDLIQSHGFHASMSLIAKNADVAAGTIYHYFESKDQLICELYEYNRNLLVQLVNVEIKKPGTYQTKFFNIWDKIYAFYEQHPKVLIFIQQYINSPYNESKRVDDHQDRPLYDFFVEGIQQGILKDTKPEILLILILNSIISIAKLHRFGDVSLTKQDLDQIKKILWDGMVIH